MSGNGLHGLGNGMYVLGNGPHLLGIMSQFGIMLHLGFCFIQGYVKWYYVIRGYVVWGIMSHLALCRIQTYVFWLYVLRFNVVRRNVFRDNIVWSTVGVSFISHVWFN